MNEQKLIESGPPPDKGYMSLGDVFAAGGKAVGNFIVLEGGRAFLIGDIGVNDNFDGFLNQKVEFIACVTEKMEDKIEAVKMKAAI